VGSPLSPPFSLFFSTPPLPTNPLPPPDTHALQFEPELFPGLIYKLRSPKVAMLVFVSGRVVITGAKTRTAIVDAIDMVLPLLVKYKKRTRAERAEEEAAEEEV
jgi:hypothetical protein